MNRIILDLFILEKNFQVSPA